MAKRKPYNPNPRHLMNVETQEEARLMAMRIAPITRRVIVVERPKKPAGQWKLLTQTDIPGWERTALRQIARGLNALVLFELNEEARKALSDVQVVQLDTALRGEEPEKERAHPDFIQTRPLTGRILSDPPNEVLADDEGHEPYDETAHDDDEGSQDDDTGEEPNPGASCWSGPPAAGPVPLEEGLATSPTAAANERSWDAVGTRPDTHAPDGERLPSPSYPADFTEEF